MLEVLHHLYTATAGTEISFTGFYASNSPNVSFHNTNLTVGSSNVRAHGAAPAETHPRPEPTPFSSSCCDVRSPKTQSLPLDGSRVSI